MVKAASAKTGRFLKTVLKSLVFPSMRFISVQQIYISLSERLLSMRSDYIQA